MIDFIPVWHCKFNANSKWKDSSGATISIVMVYPYDDESEDERELGDYCVIYQDSKGGTYQKDAWNFQVRYAPA